MMPFQRLQRRVQELIQGHRNYYHLDSIGPDLYYVSKPITYGILRSMLQAKRAFGDLEWQQRFIQRYDERARVSDETAAEDSRFVPCWRGVCFSVRYAVRRWDHFQRALPQRLVIASVYYPRTVSLDRPPMIH